MPATSANRLLAPALLVGASCAFSTLAILRDPLVDANSVRTLVAALAIAQQQSFPWPPHALLIALLHTLTGLPLQASAQLLDGALFALLALAFARLVTLVGGERRSYGWGALVLLLYPQLNLWRGQVLDETGLWAALMWALVALARYQRAPRWGAAFAFALCCALATLFRLEALVFALLLPLACLKRGAEAAGGTLRLYAALGSVALLPLLVVARFGELDTLADNMLPAITTLPHAIAQGFGGAVSHLATRVLGAPSAGLAPFALLAALLVVLLLAFARALGLIYVLLLGWAVATRRALLPDNDRRALVLGFAGAALLIALAMLARDQALEPRALVPLCLAALVPAAFAARELLRAASSSRRPLAATGALAAVLVALFASGFLSFGTRTSYVSESIAWMEGNLPANARVFSNDAQLAWYSARTVDWNAVWRGDGAIIARTAPLASVDFWVLRIDGGNDALENALAAYADVLEPVAQFEGAHHDRIVLLRRAGSALAASAGYRVSCRGAGTGDGLTCITAVGRRKCR